MSDEHPTDVDHLTASDGPAPGDGHAATGDDYQFHSTRSTWRRPGSGRLVDPLRGCAQAARRRAGAERSERRVPRHTITVVLGPSGTGKSVLIKHMIGLMFPDSGDIIVHGPVGAEPDDAEAARAAPQIGVLFQDGALFGSMSVFDNVAFPLRQHTDTLEAQISELVSEGLLDVGPGHAMDVLPSQLSGGMRKRAGFARALVMEPEIVIFDEPDSGLDPVRTALLCELIQEMHSIHGGTYIVVTHDIASARGSASSSRSCGGGGSWKRETRRRCSPRRTPSYVSSSADRRRGR